MIAREIDRLIQTGKPFAVYSLPDEQHCRAVYQTDHELYPLMQGDKIGNNEGFVVFPFDHSKPGYLIKGTEQLLNKTGISLKELIFDKKNKDGIPEKPYIANRSEYLRQCNNMISQVKNGELNKVVLSRVLEFPYPENFTSGRFFSKLHKKYNKAFTFLWNHPQTGIWMGASPELLMQYKEGGLTTMSLAGTRKMIQSNSGDLWPVKEKAEQEYVTDYITDILKDFSSQIHITGPQTILSGQLEHIQSQFTIQVKREMAEKILWKLHPTPAVCGKPAQEAFQLIQETESHNREYYTGFCGPVYSSSLQLFVNLRSAKIESDRVYLFAGGGLTEDSIPENEWKETEIKAETLLSILKNYES